MPTLVERLVIDMGQGSYGITLPKAWVRYFGIKPGDKLEVVPNGELRVCPKENGGPPEMIFDTGDIPEAESV